MPTWLTSMSEYPTLDVMTENNPSTSSPFFELPPAAPAPRPQRLPVTIDRARVETLDVDGLTTELMMVLGRLKNRTPAELLADGVAPDGSAAIKSLIAVCLIGTVGKAFDQPRLVNLARVRRDDLRSVRGVARLIRASLDQHRRGAA
jgi:hypothetical protein